MDLDEIGARIQKERLARNVSQEAISSVVRISRPTLSQLENGNLTEIGIRKVIEVLAQLGLELTIRQAHRRPTLREIAEERNQLARTVDEEPQRKRAGRRSTATGKPGEKL